MNGYMTRFFRRDGQPCEEYCYQSREEAENHLNLFVDDDSGLYSQIDVIDLGNMKQIAMLIW